MPDPSDYGSDNYTAMPDGSLKSWGDIDWRKEDHGSMDDDDAEPTEAERRAVIAILGFDPRELDDDLEPPRHSSPDEEVGRAHPTKVG